MAGTRLVRRTGPTPAPYVLYRTYVPVRRYWHGTVLNILTQASRVSPRLYMGKWYSPAVCMSQSRQTIIQILYLPISSTTVVCTGTGTSTNLVRTGTSTGTDGTSGGVWSRAA
eukprot:SAG22_NODE_2228_length_2813_cov_1.258290_3_plen_113_part_00